MSGRLSRPFPADVKAAVGKIRDEMSGVCNFATLTSGNWKRRTGWQLEEKVDFVLADSPYNIRRLMDKMNTVHDCFTSTDIQ